MRPSENSLWVVVRLTDNHPTPSRHWLSGLVQSWVIGVSSIVDVKVIGRLVSVNPELSDEDVTRNIQSAIGPYVTGLHQMGIRAYKTLPETSDNKEE